MPAHRLRYAWPRAIWQPGISVLPPRPAGEIIRESLFWGVEKLEQAVPATVGAATNLLAVEVLHPLFSGGGISRFMTVR